MNATFYLKLFAWIAIVGLSCAIFADYWIPILIGAATFTFLVMAVASKKPERK